MSNLTSSVRRFLTSEDGPTAVEYAVLISLVAITLIGAVSKLTSSISGTFTSVSSTLGANS